jgi:Xaa-Pro dipeptidase
MTPAVSPSAGEGPRWRDGYPHFSDAEMARRIATIDESLGQASAGHLVAYGAERSGSAIAWLTGWPVTREAVLIHSPGEPPLLLVNFYNHVPAASRIADRVQVRWAGPDAITTTVAELRRRGAAGARIGVLGALPHRAHAALSAVGEPVELDRAYVSARQIKSDEELAWLRIGARMTDEALRAVWAAARPGTGEAQLADRAERAYVAAGGTTHIHYFGACAMDEPTVAVPAQFASDRRLAAGDVLSSELSASFWGYTGQVLRTFTIDAPPAALFDELHAVADAAFDAVCARLRDGTTAAELVDASGVIEQAGFTIRDDLVHGFVGGYWPPVLGSSSRALTPVPDFTYRAGMTVVVQPNVVTRDERAGVQTGELVLVTDAGVSRLHDVPRGLLAAPSADGRA